MLGALPVLSPPPSERQVRRRTRRDPNPRFKPDVTAQLDAVAGCPSLQVPHDHLARVVTGFTVSLDYSALEAKYSSLGRHGYRPRHVLGVLVYGSLIGLHHSTKLARALETDAALRLLSGGYAISAGKLRAFRRNHLELFQQAITATLVQAREAGLLPVDELAVDSMRLRANASTKAVRTVVRSTKRLGELSKLDTSELSAEQRETHEAKLAKHREALAQCEAAGRPNVVLTNEAAGLMKFPDGAGLPGHRITAIAAGVQERLIIAVLVDADANDYGKLEGAVCKARAELSKAGVPQEAVLQVAADAGYCSSADLAFAADHRDWADVLVASESAATDPNEPTKHFGREAFKLLDDGTAICPAGKPMLGPTAQPDGRTKWRGADCPNCPLREQCTPGQQRALYINPELERGRKAMAERMARPGARERYNQRIATIEPAFSNIEDVMGFRRASSRHATTILAEVLLKVLAHNISRLAARRQLAVVYFSLGVFQSTL